MGDPYPYNYSSYPTKPKPMDAFLRSFLGNMEKVLMYKYQQTLQDDSAAKRLAMERQYEAERQAVTAENFANDPLRNAEIDLKKAEAEKIRYGLANPKAEDITDTMLRQFLLGQGGAASPQGGTPVMQGATPQMGSDPAIVNPIIRGLFQKKGIPDNAALRMVPKNDEEQSLDEADRELGIVRKDIDAQTLEENKISRERERDINLLMTSGRVKNRAEAEKILADTDASKRLGDKPEAAPSEMKLFIDGYREANPTATKADVFAAYKEQKRGDVQAELEMRDALMKDRWYPTAYLDQKTGLPIVGDRAGTFRVGDISGGVVPVVKPTEADKKTSSEINNIQEGIARIRTNYSKDFVGPIAGRYGGAKEMTIGLPPAQAEFYADVRSMKDALLRAKSGAQINEQEYRRLVKFLPDENSPASVFETRLLRFEKEMDSIIRGRTNARQGVMPKPSTDLRPIFGAPPVPGTTIDLDTEIDSYIPGR